MEQDATERTKRGPGRPKGTKNRKGAPSATGRPVGRPAKARVAASSTAPDAHNKAVEASCQPITAPDNEPGTTPLAQHAPAASPPVVVAEPLPNAPSAAVDKRPDKRLSRAQTGSGSESRDSSPAIYPPRNTRQISLEGFFSSHSRATSVAASERHGTPTELPLTNQANTTTGEKGKRPATANKSTMEGRDLTEEPANPELNVVDPRLRDKDVRHEHRAFGTTGTPAAPTNQRKLHPLPDVTSRAPPEPVELTCDFYDFDDFDGGLDQDLGVGGTDAFQGEGEDREDEADNFGTLPDDDEMSPATSKQPNSTLPHWLKSKYKEICTHLREEADRNRSKQPSCYENGSFFIRPKNPLFKAARIFQIEPEIFYEPTWFVWLPHFFVDNQSIPCPECRKAGRTAGNHIPVALQLNGWTDSPRRIVDIDQNIYIIGYRYKCGRSECKKTYQSWSPALLDALPPAVASQFTFYLTHRCGVTDRLIALLRSSFQRGHGPSPFAAMIRTFYIRRHEKLQLLYYELVKSRMETESIRGLLVQHPRFGLWNDRAKYAGYVPSGRYFGDLYNAFMERHACEIDQHMAMLSCRILTIDHSFKVPKHIGKVNGEPVFGALHTGINEYNEVRTMTLTPTKAHNQFMPALATIPHSLREYGHDDIELVFTDNVRGDKAELEKVFPSLRRDVKPIPSSTTLDALVIPLDWTIVILESSFQITFQMNLVMEQVSRLGDGEYFDVGMDMEWPVDEGIQGYVAVVTLVVDKKIYLIRLSKLPLTATGYLNPPSALLALLRSPRIRKYGVHIKADFTRLFKNCGFDTKRDIPPFSGAIELGAMAHERNLTQRSNTSLQDLVGVLLKRYISKNETVCISTAWVEDELSSDAIRYASLDGYATWTLQEHITSVASQRPISLDTPPGTQVKLLSRDGSSVVAIGYVAPDRASVKKHNGVNVTRTRTLINITAIIQPAYLVRGALLPSKADTAISEVAQPLPYRMLCDMRDVQIAPGIAPVRDLPRCPLPPHPYTPNHDPYSDPIEGIEPHPDPSLLSEEESMDDIERLQWPALISHDAETEQLTASSAADPAAMSLADKYIPAALATTAATVSGLYSDPELRSRVLGDIWHLMDQFKISRTHGLRHAFARALRDAIFIPDPEDKAAVERFLATQGITWDQMVLWKSNWVWKRVRRFVPRADVLAPRVAQVIRTYGPLVDATTSQPLFNEASFLKAKNILENIHAGYYSDPCGVKLYTPDRKDKFGLQLYHCLRGTNGVEGGVHQNIARRFGSYCASPQFAANLLRDYCSHHNLVVGTLNRTGKPFQGSFDIWTRNHLADLIDVTRDMFDPTTLEPSLVGWVNGTNYRPSRETFGILPLSPASKQTLGMDSFSVQHAKDNKIRHYNLAIQQETRFAVLPVHTQEERALFREFLRPDGPFTHGLKPNWITLTAQWSAKSDGVKVFYKLPEHLKNFYKSWLETRNEKNSFEPYRATFQQVASNLTPDRSAIPPIPIAERTLVAAQITALPLPRPAIPADWTMINTSNPPAEQSGPRSSTGSQAPTALVFKNSSAHHFQQTLPVAAGSASSGSRDKGKKRAQPSDFHPGPNLGLSRVMYRKPRTCLCCGGDKCKGRGGEHYCPNFAGSSASGS